MRRAPLPRIRVQWWLTVLILCGTVTVLGLGQWLWRLDLQLYDSFSTRSLLAVDPDILIVAIDDRSLAELGRWPWPREQHAALLDRLREAGSRAVGLDLILSEPAEGDALLAQAIRRNGRVTLPVLQREDAQRIAGVQRPVAALAQAAAGLGHIQIELDPDGLARSVYLWEGWQRPDTPQLGLAMLLTTGRSHLGYSQRQAGERQGLWLRDQWLRIPFAGAPGSIASVSYTDVLNRRVPLESLRDKWVLVGVTAAGLSDSLPVPSSGFSRPMPGIEIHANILNALLQDAAVTMASPTLTAAVSALLCLLLLVVLIRTSPRTGLLFSLGFALIVLLASSIALREARFWISPSATLLACLLAYPLWSWRRLEATQRYLRDALIALPSPDLPISSGADQFQHQLAAVEQAVATTRDAHRLLEATVAHLPVAVLAFNADGTLRLANEAAQRLLLRRRREDLARQIRAIRWPTSIATTDGLPEAPDQPFSFEERLPEGAEVEIGLSSWLPGCLLVSIVDLRQIKASQIAREDALRIISHDFQSPLAAMLALIDADLPDAQKLPRLHKLARRALDLAEETLMLGSAEALDARRFVPVDLVQILYEAGDLAWEAAQAASLSIEINDGGQDSAWVAGQRDMLLRALGNLLSNAIKYGRQGKRVELHLLRDDACWLLQVRDHGHGIPEGERAQLFQRFGRLPSATASEARGFGLGLMIVKAIAERHGGSVSASFPREGGSCFSLRLPALPEETAAN